MAHNHRGYRYKAILEAQGGGIFHDVVLPDGKCEVIDFDANNAMTKRDFQTYVDLGLPSRFEANCSGNFTAQTLAEMFRAARRLEAIGGKEFAWIGVRLGLGWR